MGSLAEQKYKLIQQITAIDDPALLEWLSNELDERHEDTVPGQLPIDAGPNLSAEELKKKYHRPTRKKFDAEAIKKEQGWTGQHDREGMMKLIEEMDIQEPIEELLAMLTP